MSVAPVSMKTADFLNPVATDLSFGRRVLVFPSVVIVGQRAP